MCMRGGISGRAASAVIGICVVFSPILVPVMITAVGINAAKKAVDRVKRKRASNVLIKTRNRVVKKLGKERFDSYLQSLFDKAALTANPSYEVLLELGVALFVDMAPIAAEEYLSRAVDCFYQSASAEQPVFKALYTRGLVRQHLNDLAGAEEDFKGCVEAWNVVMSRGGAVAPTEGLTLADMHSSLGFVKYLRAVYGEVANKTEAVSLLTSALVDHDRAVEGSQGKEGMHLHNRGLASYFLALNWDDEGRKHKALEAAAHDWDAATRCDNFGTTAEGHSWRAQALALLGHMEEARAEQAEAERLDPKVFTVDLESAEALAAPWPLPEDVYQGQLAAHDYEDIRVYKPTWCGYCHQLIGTTDALRGRVCRCTHCRMVVHASCKDKGGRFCWSVSSEDIHVGSRVKLLRGGSAGGAALVVTERTKNGMFNLAPREGAPATHFSVSSSDLSLDGSGAGGSSSAATVISPLHKHVVKEKLFHRPHLCRACGKVMLGLTRGLQCESCPFHCHTTCVPDSALIAPNGKPQ